VIERTQKPVEDENPARPGEDNDLEVLHLALRDLRREIRLRAHSDVDFDARSDGVEERTHESSRPEVPREFDWFAAFSELRHRLGTFGMVERSAEVDEFGMDEVTLDRSRILLDFLMDRYFRVEVLGLEAVDSGLPSLLVANRSGLLPYDGLMLAHALERWHPRHARPRFLVADWLITLPFAQPFLARLGGVRACRENADRLLRKGHSVIAFPEGVKGAGKVFAERYALKRFGRGGVIRAAVENGVPLVPVGIVGAEEAHPILFKAYTPARALGLPFIPVTPTFPWLGPAGLIPLPTKWIVNVGEPIPLDDLEVGALDDELLLSRLTEELRGRIQELVDQALERRDSVWQ
jgi:1-acyl-sn-glycerol-3-phosphate acyltransferase